MKKKYTTSQSGQAVVEYILLFSFLMLIMLAFVRGINGAVSETMGGLAYALSHQLTIGVCENLCFYSDYAN